MKKMRSDSKWFALSRAKLATLETWLFDENLSYGDALVRAKTELGFTGSKSSIQRFYNRRSQERLLKELFDSGKEAHEVSSSPVSEGVLLGSGMKLLGRRFFQQAKVEADVDVPTMARLLLHSEANELQREQNTIRRDAQSLRRQRLDFEQERWQYDLIEEALKRLPELEQLKEDREDAEDPYAGNRRTNSVRRNLFGSAITNWLPESPEEEVAWQAAKAREQAEHQREHEEMLAREREQKTRARSAPISRPPVPPSEPVAPKWEDTEPGNRFPFNDSVTAARWSKSCTGKTMTPPKRSSGSPNDPRKFA